MHTKIVQQKDTLLATYVLLQVPEELAERRSVNAVVLYLPCD